ncbi:MAG: hypothetical protein OXC28_19740 [Defluviicoccus sp.]|nr:hypothetical protein [Defluviicoccus sp.]
MPWRRFTRAEREQLDAQIVGVLRDDHPQSMRHAFYRMADPRLPVPVDNTEEGYQHVQRRCLELRRNGSIPYGWISDATRCGYHVNTFDNAGEFIDRVAGVYRSTLWTPDLPRVEVWCESRSIVGVLQAECERLAVSLYLTGGFSSATLAHEAAEHIDACDAEYCSVLYIGDYDPAGLLIDRSLESELRKHLDTPLVFRRLAINEEQIDLYDLPTKPRKATDRRRLDIHETVEAEAMPAADLRSIVRLAVEAHLPSYVLRVAQEAEERALEGLHWLSDRVEEEGLDPVPRGPAG